MRTPFAMLSLAGLVACSGGEVRPGSGNVDPNLTVTDVVIAPDDPTTTTPLSVTATVTDARSRDFTVDYAWYVNDQVVLQGDTTTLDPSLFLRDQIVFVEVVASAGQRGSAPVRSDTVRIRNTPPTLTSAAIEPAEPTSADPLTCVATGMADADQDPVSLIYRWVIDGSPLALDSEILPARSAIRGQTVQCEVTPTDGTDSGEPVLSPAVVVGNGAPFIASVIIEPRPAFTTSLLTATPSVSDPDGDPITLRWQWTVNGSPAGTTGALSPDRFVRGDTVQVRAIAFDGELDSPPRTSEALVISNSPPTAPAVALGPELASAGRPIQCEISRPSTDPDGDSLSYIFDFYRDGEIYTGPVLTTSRPNDTVPGGQVNEGEVWTCTSQAWDRTALSPWSAESAPLLIGPPIFEIDIAVGDLVNQGVACGAFARYNGSCSGTYGFTWVDEADDLPREIEVRYNFGVNCAFSTEARAATLNGTAVGTAPIGETRLCSCSPSDPAWERSFTFAPPDTYRPGGENTFLLTSLSCEGFTRNADWTLDDGTLIFARVILRY